MAKGKMMVSFEADVYVIETLDEIAELMERTRSAIIRKAVRQFINSELLGFREEMTAEAK